MQQQITTVSTAMPPQPLDSSEDRAEQLRRCAAIDRVDYLCAEYGIETVRGWIAQPETAESAAAAEGIAGLVDAFGVERVQRWVKYMAWREGRA